jgi:hypothetical protein
MKTSNFATAALSLAICIMALVPITADAKPTAGVGENGPLEAAEVDKEERVLCSGNRKLDQEERVLCESSGMPSGKKGGKKGGKKSGKKGGAVG